MQICKSIHCMLAVALQLWQAQMLQGQCSMYGSFKRFGRAVACQYLHMCPSGCQPAGSLPTQSAGASIISVVVDSTATSMSRCNNPTEPEHPPSLRPPCKPPTHTPSLSSILLVLPATPVRPLPLLPTHRGKVPLGNDCKCRSLLR